jgi:hypothetical protein
MKDNGGSAFPVPNDANVNDEKGMSLRDYFAAAALQGLIVNGQTVNVHCPLSVRAYEIADAMLAERSKP